MKVLPLPEDHPLFDPEDDRAEYAALCESVDEIDFDEAVWAGAWPESVDA